MKFTITLILSSLICFNSLGREHEVDHNLSSDASLLKVLNHYEKAFNEKDTTFLNAWTIKQSEYDAIVGQLKSFNVACLKASDIDYSVRTVYDEFSNAVLSKTKMDSVAFTKSSNIQGCGGISVKKIDAKAYFKNKSVEIPFSLIFIKDLSSEYKLLNQILNYKMIDHE